MTDASMELKTAVITPDGKIFESKKEAQDYLRRPKIKEALQSVTEGNDELSDWIIENTDELEGAFQTGTIRRVTKNDRTKYEKALEHAATLNDPKLAFLVENKTDLVNGLRWPSVTRIKADEKEAAIKAELMALTEQNEEIVDFLIDKRAKIFEALEAGKVKKEINPKATEGLAKWRAEQKAKKEAETGGEAPAETEEEEEVSEEAQAEVEAPKKTAPKKK